MANIRSSEKSAKKEAIKRVINRSRMNTLRTYVRKLQDALKSNVKDDIKQSFIAMQSQVSKSVSTGLIKKNKASRIVSRLNEKCKTVILSK